MSKPSITTLADLPEQHAKNFPDRTALVYGDTKVTFNELNERSNQLAHAICDAGLEPQAQVAVLDRNSENFFYILFGASKANNSLVTVNFRLTSPEIAYILEDSKAELLFVGEEYLATILDCRDQLPKLKEIIVINSETDNLATWIANKSTSRPADRIASPEDRCVQMYTSGTTGKPKGVELSQRAMVIAAIEGLTCWPAMYQPEAAVLATMPLFHIAAANLCIAGLYAGARAEILRESKPAELADIIATHGITVVPVPAAIIHAIINLPNIKELDFSHLDTMLIAGSSIAVELLRDAQLTLNCGFALSYGMTESCGGLTYLGPNVCVHDAGKKLFSAGKPLGACKVKIVDNNGIDLPAGETGEIYCQSARLMTAYWNRPQATAEAFDGEWFKSGDAGYIDEEGFLYVVDRIKDMVISGGENIYPAEIENELMKHPVVDDVTVIGVPDEKWGEALLACIILKQGQQIEDQALIEFLRNSLASYKIPRKYRYVDAFPRNATGKVLKREMRTQYQ